MVFSSAADVRAAIRSSGARRLRAEPLRLRAPQLSPAQATAWEARIRRYATACGCGTGAAFLILAAIGLAAVAIVRPVAVVAAPVRFALEGAGIVVASAIGGKLLGLIWARIRLRQVLENLATVLSEPAGPHASVTSRDPWR